MSFSVKEITQKPVLTTTIVLGGVCIILFSLSFTFYKNDAYSYFSSLLIEAHGMIFDLLIIGILLLWLNKKGEKYRRISHYENEIDDFRHWKSEEAAYRIMGNIKRLNRDGVFKLDLHKCYIPNVNLGFVKLIHSNFNYADMRGINLALANLESSRLNQANLDGACLNKAHLKYTFLSGANLANCSAVKTDFSHAVLIKANFENAYMINADMRYTDLSGACLDNAHLYMADFTHAKGLTVEQLSKAKNLYKIKLDAHLLDELKIHYPQLLENNFTSSPVEAIAS
jgi:BTB/POZ domain-containing protein KCTD9